MYATTASEIPAHQSVRSHLVIPDRALQRKGRDHHVWSEDLRNSPLCHLLYGPRRRKGSPTTRCREPVLSINLLAVRQRWALRAPERPKHIQPLRWTREAMSVPAARQISETSQARPVDLIASGSVQARMFERD